MLEVSIPWCPQVLDIDSLSPAQGGCSKLLPLALVRDKHSGRAWELWESRFSHLKNGATGKANVLHYVSLYRSQHIQLHRGCPRRYLRGYFQGKQTEIALKISTHY